MWNRAAAGQSARAPSADAIAMWRVHGENVRAAVRTLQTALPQGGVLRRPRPSWVRFRLSWCVPTHPSACHAATSKYSPVLRSAAFRPIRA
eukprot:215452-Chlamydomonas_euryale.AAC.1